MRKAISILLVLILNISVLAACGGETEEPAAPVVDEPKIESTPEPAPEPVAVPIADGMNTVEIISAEYGDIIFSYPDDGSVTVMIAEPGAEDRSLIPTEEFREFLGVIIMNDNNIDFQKALIAGDDFNIMVGYTDYYDGGGIHNTFSMVVNSKMQFGAKPLTFDGLDGIIHYQHVATISFPAITQIAGRVILVFPNVIEEGDDVGEMSRELFERDDVQAILSTFRFPGEILDEPRLETQPIDNPVFSLTPADGWEVSGFSTMWHTYELQKGDMKINTESSTSKSVKDQVEEYIFDTRNVYTDSEQVDNITFNGHEFVVYHNERWEMFFLLTSRGDGPLDINSDGFFMMEIRRVNNLDDLMPLLNTLKVK